MIFWHATPKENIFDIMKNGIKADFQGFIYLCKKPEDCLEFFVLRPDAKNKYYALIPIEIDTDKVKESHDHNREIINADSFVYSGDIPADKIPQDLNEILLYKLE